MTIASDTMENSFGATYDKNEEKKDENNIISIDSNKKLKVIVFFIYILRLKISTSYLNNIYL